MKIKKIPVAILALLVIFTSVSFTVPRVQSQLKNYVYIEPREPSTGTTPFAITLGQVVMVNVTIENAVNIYGYNLTIYMQNPSIVEYIDYKFHPFLEEPYTTNIISIGNKITLYAKSQEPANPVNKSGPLVTLYYKGKSIGESLINFDGANCYLIKQDGTQFTPSTFKRGKLAVTKTKIAVEPEELSGSKNQIVKANITVYNVEDLYGIQFNLTWNPEILKLSKVHYQIPWSKSFEQKNETGPGYYQLAVSAMYPATGYSGNYTFVNIEFNVTETGLTKIRFQNTELGNSDGAKIVHARVDALFSNIAVEIGFSPSVIADAGLTEGKIVPIDLTIKEAYRLKDFVMRISYPSRIINFSKINYNETVYASFNFRNDPLSGFLDLNGTFNMESTGNLSIAKIEFQVVGFGSEKISIISEKSSLKDGDGNEILFKTASCRFTNWRNVGITLFELTSPVKLGDSFLIGENITISVGIENLGASAENVSMILRYEGNVTVEGNTTLVHGNLSNETIQLEKFGNQNSSKIFTIEWNTKNLKAGLYRVIANATVELDHDHSDNIVTETLNLVEYAIDLAIINVLVSPPIISVNETATLTIIVKNLGLTTQTFNLLINLDDELIEEYKNVTLVGESGDMFFVTLPKFSEPGKHQLNCTIPAVPGEVKLQNNVYTLVLNVGLLEAAFPFETITLTIVALIVVLAALIFYRKQRKP